ncbi:MAG TPA: hypothetical protein VFT72_13170 [Opitutaceae bacterium]|nr:hypothetical protein [Opitutaceae bacterium]
MKSSRRIRFVLALTLPALTCIVSRGFAATAQSSAAASAVVSAGVEHIYHVEPAPRGSDENDGSGDKPFATLERARNAVRERLARGKLRGDLVVEVSAGRYELAAPLRLEPEDSGQPGARVIYRAAAGERVILSGGRKVSGWAPEPEKIWSADVGHGVDFRQLWIDGRRATRARRPNVGQTEILTSDKQADGFNLPRDLLADMRLRPAEVEIAVSIAWMHKRLRIARLADVPKSSSTVRAVIAAQEWDAITRQPQGDRVYSKRHYWLENAREFLDAPGEFFLDRATGRLSYWPRLDEKLTEATVVRPELENLVVLAGRLDAPVHDLVFEGFDFVETGWTRPNRAGFVDVQANSLVPENPAGAVDAQYRHQQKKDRVAAAFQATSSDRVVIRHCQFARLGGTAVMFTGGGFDNVIEGNGFFDIAAGGIEIGEDAARPKSPRLIPQRTRVANNVFVHIGQDYFGSVAVLGYYTDELTVAHNEMAALPYTAVSVGWGWGTPPAPPESRGNRILHNRLFNYMRRLDDGGGIYTTDAQPGSEIAYNWLERMAPPDTQTKAGGALYLDQFTSGYHVHHNVVAGAVRWLNIWNPNIHDNRIEANYADTTSQRNDGTDNFVEPVHLAPAGDWPAEAQKIQQDAGLEKAFGRARQIEAPATLMVESTSVDFEAVSGNWTPVPAPAGSYGATVQSSDHAGAAARWSPFLPEAGEFEVSVRRLPGAASVVYSVKHDNGLSTTTVAGEDDATPSWVSLGVFHFHAGIGAEVIARAEGRGTVQLDTIRFAKTKADQKKISGASGCRLQR